MNLFDYQKEAVDFIAQKKRVYLALEMGLGKTLTSLAAALNHGKKNALVVAEKNEIVNSENFKREIENHFYPNLQYINLREDDLPKSHYDTRFVCGINPDALIKHDLAEIAANFDVMVVDESTMAKNTATQRFQRIRKVAKEMEYLFLLSGTPMMNGAAELFAPLLLLEHPLVAGRKGAKKAFEAVFAGGHYRKIRNTGVWWQDYVWWAKGANYVRELRWLIRDNFFFKQKLDTTAFKKKVRIIVSVPMGFSWIAEYSRAWNDYLKGVAEHNSRAKAEKMKDLDNISALQNLIEQGQCYQVNSRWKAKRVAEDIAVGKYGDRRIVVYSMFIETDKILQEELARRGVSFRPFEEIQEWKTGTEQVLVGRIIAHGKGANLPEASVALFVDMSFVPAQNIQAENRIDRPEQKNEMLVVYYMTEGDDVVDAHVRKINQDKARKIDNFMKPLTAEEVAEMPSLLEKLRAKFPKEAGILGI